MSTPICMRQTRQAATKADPLGLTPRERQVAELLGWCDTPTTAATLGIAPATVARHRKGIFRKLGVRDRHELRARLCLQALTVELSEPFAESTTNG